MAEIPALIQASAEKLIALHERIHKSEANPATIEVHHNILNEMARRKMQLPKDEWDKYEILVDTAENVDLESLTATLPEQALDNLVKATGSYIANVQTVLTVNGYEMRFEPVELNEMEKMIRREDGWWVVYNKEGTRSFGKYKSKADAHKRLAEMEYFSKASYVAPKGARVAARRALDWISEGKAGGGFTSVGRHRAQQLASGESLSIETVKRMKSFFSRHEVDKDAVGFSQGEKGYPSAGRVAWDAWGGDAGFAWAKSVVDEYENGLKKHLQGQHDQKSHAPKFAEDIARGIENGEHPSVDPNDVGPLFNGLAKLTTHPDITELKVKGTMLFGDEGLGVARKDMPQVPAKERDRFLKDIGAEVTEEEIDPRTLKPVQKEISGSRAGAIYNNYKASGEIPEQERILVSKDGYVIDGHHTWAASVAFAFDDNSAKLPIYRIGLTAKEALDAANKWADDNGFARQALDAKEPIKKHGNHDQSSHGNWAHGGETVDGITEADIARRAGMIARRDIPPLPRDASGRIINPDATGGYKAGVPEEVTFHNTKLTPQDSLWHHLVPDGRGGYELSQERALLHSQIINQATGNVPESTDPTFYMLGGGPATGKTRMLKSGQTGVPDKTQAVHINADDAKEKLPENSRMRNSSSDADYFNAASFSHEESSILAKAIQAKAIRNNQDIVLDGTGDSAVSKLASKVEQARQEGYKVEGVYVTVPTNVAWDRAVKRALGPEKRFVPELVLRTTHADVSVTLPLAMKANLFDKVTLWDNNGSVPRIIATQTRNNKPDIPDEQGWKDFIAKANQ